MKINRFNENNNIQFKVFYKRYSIYENDDIDYENDDIEFLLQDSEYLNDCKINNIIYYKYFDQLLPNHFTFKIYAFPINMDEKVIIDRMNFNYIKTEDDISKSSLNPNDLWTEVEYDEIEVTINSKKFNI